MELDATEAVSGPSSGSSSPPDTPINTPLSSYPSPNPQAVAQQAPSRPPPISAFDTTTVLPSRSTHPLGVGFPPVRAANSMVQPRAEDAFNAYAGYSDYSSLLPGTVPSSAGPSASDDSTAYPGGQYGARSGCVPPALLLNSTTGSTSHSTPSSSRVASPTPGTSKFPTSIAAAASSSAPASPTHAQGSQTARASTTLSRPATSLLLSKPFKCPKPNCNKSYKQANGLKYHMTHGSCNFAHPKDLEQLQALLASKRNGEEGGEPITDAELREVEKEAERRLRPYACGVGDCQRRYKNMNGLSKRFSTLFSEKKSDPDVLQDIIINILATTAQSASRSLQAANTSAYNTRVRIRGTRLLLLLSPHQRTRLPVRHLSYRRPNQHNSRQLTSVPR